MPANQLTDPDIVATMNAFDLRTIAAKNDPDELAHIEREQSLWHGSLTDEQRHGLEAARDSDRNSKRRDEAPRWFPHI